MRWKGASHFEFDGELVETETARSEFPSGGKAIVELLSEEKKKSKRAGLKVLGIQVGKLTNWVRSCEMEKLYQSSPGLSVLLE